MNPKNKAEQQNPTLEPLSVLIGEWTTEGTHPYVPDKTLHGRATFEWIYGGAFLLWRSEITDDSRFPAGIAIFGSDDVAKKYFMLYFDERGISRKYDVSIQRRELKWWRDDPEFSQRTQLTIADDNKTIVSKGEMRKNGGAWEPDLELTYTRAA